jgi:Translation initiation factor eIF3 subunit 135
LDENGLHYITNLRDCLPIDSHSISDTVNKLQRFRPEFLLLLPFPISSDCHTPASGATRMERSQNDEEGLKASRYLRENIIPAFVRALDGMEERVWDSASLTEAMHAAGINMRNLGILKFRLSFLRNGL